MYIGRYIGRDRNGKPIFQIIRRENNESMEK